MPIVDPFAPKAPAIVDPFAQQAAPQARGIVDPFATPEPTPESQSGFRQVADVPLQVTKGAVQGVRMLTDVLGADNPVSKGLRGVEDYVGNLLSAQSKKDSREISRIMKDAEDKGVADQVLAGVKAFSVAPVDLLANVFGNAMPVIAGGLATTLLRGGAMATTTVGAGTGAAMGTGSVKGSIYEAVKDVLSTNTKLPPDQIEKRAALAQSYNGENLDQILMGTAIGGLSAATGLEGVVARQMAQKIAGRSAGNILQREAVEKATQAATKTAAKRGPYKQGAITGVTEAGTEFGQEGQEQVAQNIAQQREGFDVPTFRGAVGAGTLGALTAAGLGTAVGAREGSQARRQMELEGTPEGQQIKNLDALIAQEEKQQRITELEQKPTRTKQEQIEVDALKQSVAAGPALTQQDMTVPPAQDELTRLKARVDEAKAKVDAAEQRFGEAPEFLVDDYEGLKTTLESKLQELEPPAARKERAAREKVQKEMDVERAAIQAGAVDETQLEGPEPPDIFAPAPKQTAIVDPFEVDPFAEETPQEAVQETAFTPPDTSGYLVKKVRGQEQWTLAKDGEVIGTYGSKKQAETAESSERLKQIDAYYEAKKETPTDQGAPIATEVLDEDAVMAEGQTNVINIDERAKKRIADLEDTARDKWYGMLFNESLQNQLKVLTDLHNKGIATDKDVDNFESVIDNSDNLMVAVAKISKLLAPLKQADRAAVQQRVETPAANEEVASTTAPDFNQQRQQVQDELDAAKERLGALEDELSNNYNNLTQPERDALQDKIEAAEQEVDALKDKRKQALRDIDKTEKQHIAESSGLAPVENEQKILEKIDDEGIYFDPKDDVDETTGGLWPDHDFYAVVPSTSRYDKPSNPRLITNLDDAKKARAAGMQVRALERQEPLTVEELRAQREEARLEMVKLHGKNGNRPNAGTKKRATFDALEQKIAEIDKEIAKRDPSAEPPVEPGALFAQADTQSAVGRFDPNEIEKIRTPGYKSRYKLIEMPIAQFLALADDIKSGDSRQKLENTRAILARGDNFTSIPYLYASNKGQVDGHEGRNRALALQELGYTTMPVELRMRDLRWSEQLDPDKFDYIENWPTRLTAQEDAKNPNYSIPFPVRRQDSESAYDANLNNVVPLESAKYAGPKGWETAETGVKASSSLHPDVAKAIENNDVNGALRAMAQNTSGFTRELAARLAELNLPVTIVFGQQRKLFRKEIDRQTAPQQVHLFSYIRQMYPDLYTKYFENFDREENLERVMDGLREFDKGKYKKAPVESEFKSVVKVFGELIPNMNAPGFFLPAFDVININPNPTFGTSNRVVLHEIVHAATEFALRSPDGLSRRQIEAVAELQKMYRYAKDRLPAGEYGLKSISEFVAELMTNKGFQDKLKNIKYQAKGASVFSRIVNAIMKLLGFDNLAGAAAIEVNEIFSAHRPFKVFPVGPLFTKKENNAGPISNADGWKIAERDGKNLKERISDLIGGHPTKADALKDLKDIIFDVAGDSARKVILPVLQLRQLKDMTRGTIPQLEASVGIVEQMTSYRGNKISGPVNGDISKSPEGITKRWSKAQGENPAQSRLMGRLMLEVTIRGIEVDPKGDGYNANKVNKALSDAWGTLLPEFQEIYRDARDYYARSVQDMVQAMKDKTKGLPNDERAKLLAQIDDQFGPDKLVRPYFPLRRFGDYWFQVGEGDNKEFYMFESASERRRALNERRRELQNGNEKQQELADTMYAGQGISTIYSHNANTSKVLGDINKMVDQLTTADPAQLKGEIKDSINQLVYLLLPQQSMRKMFINRRAVQGASADMLRVFAMTSVHSAYQQARFKYAEPFMNNISNADKYIDQLPVEQQIVYRDFVRELEARTQTVLGIEDKSAWAKMAGRITETTFFFMLTAPASAMLNIIGMQAITMPYIGGKYGYAETNKLMLKNLGRYIGTTAKRTVGPLKAGAFSSIEFPSITDSKDLDPIERRAAERFTQDGQWNISSTHDVFSMSEQPSAMYTGRTNTVKQALAAMFHQAERLNREVAMLTSFKLAYDKFKGSDKKDIRGVVQRDQYGNPVKLTDDEAFEAAIADAGDIAGLTLGDYTRQMKGRIFTKPGVNVLLQFKQYAITTSYVVLRNLYLALGAPFSKGEIAQFRAELEKNKDLTTEDIDRKVGEMEAQRKEMYKEGRRRLAGILGMAFLYGGITAMPFFSMLGPLVRMFNDDDEDDEFLNWQNDFYNGMEDMLGGWASSMYLSTGGDPQKVAEADAFGRAMANVVTRGAASTATGTALADRVSLDLKNLWFRDGKFSPDMRESLKEEVIANLGPSVGLLFNWADAWKLFQEGQVTRAFETAAPAILSKPATAFRLGTEGATNKKGVVIGNMYAEEFSAWNLAMEAIGFQTEKRAMAQKKAFQAVEYDQKVQSRHDELMNRIWFDIKFGSDTLEATLEKAAEFSAKYPGMPITPESVFNTVIKRAESDAEAEAIGARLNKKMLYKTLPMLGQ